MLNNGTGTIQSGGKIFITIPGANENIERTIPYGVQIDVTPRITADGRVTLVIGAKVEDVLSTTNDPSFLNLSSRNVTTTVTVAGPDPPARRPAAEPDSTSRATASRSSAASR